jgi:hypothetical protein
MATVTAQIEDIDRHALNKPPGSLSLENRRCLLAELRFLLVETEACDNLRHPSSRSLPRGLI